MKYPPIIAEVSVRPASELPENAAVCQVTGNHKRFIRWCDKDEPPAKPVKDGVVYAPPGWVWMLVAEGESAGRREAKAGVDRLIKAVKEAHYLKQTPAQAKAFAEVNEALAALAAL